MAELHHHDMLGTYGFMDDVIFSQRGATVQNEP